MLLIVTIVCVKEKFSDNLFMRKYKNITIIMLARAKGP